MIVCLYQSGTVASFSDYWAALGKLSLSLQFTKGTCPDTAIRSLLQPCEQYVQHQSCTATSLYRQGVYTFTCIRIPVNYPPTLSARRHSLNDTPTYRLYIDPPTLANLTASMIPKFAHISIPSAPSHRFIPRRTDAG